MYRTSDAQDLILQRNPFDRNAPKVAGLQLYQEHINITTQNWLTTGKWPIRECTGEGVTYDEPTLCSGTTIGTRETMLEYLIIMYEEIKEWITDPKCRFNISGDDKSVQNCLYYSGNYPNETTISVPDRVWYSQYNRISRMYHCTSIFIIEIIIQYIDEQYPGATQKTWIGRTEFGLTNDDGLFVEFDGITVSRSVVHQWDRFGTCPISHG